MSKANLINMSKVNTALEEPGARVNIPARSRPLHRCERWLGLVYLT